MEFLFNTILWLDTFYVGVVQYGVLVAWNENVGLVRMDNIT